MYMYANFYTDKSLRMKVLAKGWIFWPYSSCINLLNQNIPLDIGDRRSAFSFPANSISHVSRTLLKVKQSDTPTSIGSQCYDVKISNHA